MQHIRHTPQGFMIEECALATITEMVGTPAYVYSAAELLRRYETLRQAFSPLGAELYYSVKSSSNIHLLRLLAAAGSAFDVVSGGELERVLQAGAGPEGIHFAGVGKQDAELRRGLEVGIHLFNVESEAEAERLDQLAREMGKKARVAVRVNPDVDPKTHRYITTGKRENKFGLDMERAGQLLNRHQEFAGLELVGLHLHLGSQITRPEPYLQALDRILPFAEHHRAAGVPLGTLDLGGGFGIQYHGETPFDPAGLAEALADRLVSTPYRVGFEPGRYISGNAGVLATRVTLVKQSGDKRFVIADAAMNDLVRPALYGSYHRIWPAAGPTPPWEGGDDQLPQADIVGPVCESGDFLGRERPFPEVGAGDLLVVHSAGAYGFAMASNYNTRPRPVEVLVEGDAFRVIRRRETVADLLGPELEI